MGQLRAFGLGVLGLTSYHEDDGTSHCRAAFERFAPRFRFFHFYFRHLEEHCGLRCGGGEAALPNGVEWPADAGPDGRCDGELIVLPSHLVLSYVDAWDLQRVQPPAVFLDRLVRTLRVSWSQGGSVGAILHLLALERSGYIVHPSVTTYALLSVLRARASGGAPARLPRFLESRWRPARRNVSLITVALLAGAVRSDHVESEISLLIACALQAADDARRVASYDDWWLAQCHLCGQLTGLLPFLVAAERRVRPMLASLHAQLTEIRADTAMLGGSWNSPGGPLVSTHAAPLAVVISFRDLLPEGQWQARMLRERAIVPHALLPWLAANRLAEVPEEWRVMSPRLASVLCDAVLGIASPFQPRDGGPEARDEFERWLQARPVGAEPPTDGLRTMVHRFPWHPDLWLDMAVVLDTSEDNPAKALECLRASLLLDPLNPLAWQSLAAVLDRLGHPGEAQVARSICGWLLDGNEPAWDEGRRGNRSPVSVRHPD